MTTGSRTQAHIGSYRRLGVLSWLYAVAAAGAIVAAVFTLWLAGVQITDGGMAPTLAAGDVVLFDRFSKHMSLPTRGDAYAYEAEGKTVVGRIVGLPGETLLAQGGKLYVNGAALDESGYRAGDTPDMEAVTLAAGEFLILPDSRPADIAPGELAIHFDKLIGRAALRVAPISKVNFFVAE